MNVSLTPELEKFIVKQVRSGLYQTSSEVVREGLRMLHERAVGNAQRRDQLLRDLAVADEQIRNGQSIVINSPEEGRALLERIKREGRARLAAKRGKMQ